MFSDSSDQNQRFSTAKILIGYPWRGHPGVCEGLFHVEPALTLPLGLHRPPPTSVPSRPWSRISLDLFLCLPLSKGQTTILSVADQFSKMAHFTPKILSAKEIVKLVLPALQCGWPDDSSSHRYFRVKSACSLGTLSACPLGFNPIPMANPRESTRR